MAEAIFCQVLQRLCGARKILACLPAQAWSQRRGHLHGANAVDNCFFATQAEKIRSRESEFRSQLKLPARFILFAGRLVRIRVSLICSMPMPNWRANCGATWAWCLPAMALPDRNWSNGRNAFARTVCFPGFAQREDLAGLYALAEALVLPTHSDTWVWW